MKKFIKNILLVACVFVFGLVLFGCSDNNDSVLRIHIRANSNCQDDQEIKMKVKDEVVRLITPLIADCNNSNEVKNALGNNINLIKKTTNEVLKNNDFNYGCSVKINNEYFPSRDYDNKIFPADYYDALIIELGSGEGDNWWCVAYPPLCFVGEDLGTDQIKYRSKLIELISKFFN